MHKAAALEAAAHKAAALEAAVLSRQSRTRGVGGMRKAAVLEAAALEAAALEAVVPYVSVFKNTVVIVILCVSRARTSHHIDLHFMRSRVIPESSSLVYTCIRRIPPPSGTSKVTGSQSGSATPHRLTNRCRSTKRAEN